MRKTSIVFLAFLLVAISSPNISGESLQTKLIPAEAKWLIHIDIAKFSQTELNQIIDNNFGREIRKIEKKADIDFFNDISAVTIIGMNHDNKEPVMAFSGSMDMNHLIGLLEEEEETPEEINYGNFIIYNWDDEGYGVFAQENLLIISENRSGVETVLDTFSGKEKDFIGTPLQRQISDSALNSFLVASAGNVSDLLDEDDEDFGAVLLKKTKSAVFSISEQNSTVKLHLSLQTDSAETATNMESMVTGLKAFLSMNEKIDPEWDIIKSLKVTSKDTTVALESQGSIEELLNVLMGKK